MNLRHLDIGCGQKPRNPYRAGELFGVDIRPLIDVGGVTIRGADLFREPIPFEDSFFDSVSAYDFLEHIPRTSINQNETRFPFIEVMNEVWRVLKDGGYFYASTPAYPHPAAFQDPTHVNIITRKTHIYFTEPQVLGRIYGFNGNFKCIRSIPVCGGVFEYEPTKTQNWFEKLGLYRRDRRKKHSHLVWEFQAIKAD